MLLIKFIVSLFLTILIEVPLLCINTKTKEKVSIIFILINIITNVSLNIINLITLTINYYIWFDSMIILETLIPYIEFLMLKYFYKDLPENYIVKIYIVNFLSFTIGGILMKFIF